MARPTLLNRSAINGAMTISVGDKIPDVKLMTATSDGIQPVQSSEVLGSGRVVLFAVPGAFTPTCSEKHLPGFVVRAEDIKDKGVDTIACIAVNDAFVMGAWGAQQDPDGHITFLADGNGDFTAELGLAFDGSGFGLGSRSQRYAAIIEDGVVTELMVEPAPGLDVSSAESVLGKL
jgi:glutaredoxin/glutathione-dependent peroxiredoxin